MKHVITSAAAALATVTLVLGANGTAHAEQVSVDDRTGDVWKTPKSDRGRMVEAGSTLNGDIDTTVVDHGVDTLTITTTYKRLEKKKVALQPYYLIRTDTDAEFIAAAFAGPREWEGGHMFWETSVPAMRFLRGTPTPEEPCAEMTHRFNWRQDTATVEIPRSCVGDASWVKVKSLSLSARPSSDRMWVDNGHIGGHAFKGWTGQVDAEIPPVD